MAVSAAEIKTQILAGTFPADTLNDDNVFDYPQYERRRRYPSCEILVNNPPSTTETQRDTQTTYGFEVRLYTKNLGIRSDEVTTQNTLESVIMTQLEAMVLQDHKIVFESKMWRREQFQRDQTHPAFLMSTLVVQVRQITTTTLTRDGVLTLTYLEDTPVNISFDCFDTVVDEGYRHIEEQVTNNPDGLMVGVNYAGAFSGIFSTNIIIKAADIGTTPEKLNQIFKIGSNGYVPTSTFSYTDKMNTASPATVTDIFYVTLINIQRMYRANDNTVYRLTGHVVKPSVIS